MRQLSPHDYTRISAESRVSIPTIKSYLDADGGRRTTAANRAAIEAAMIKLGYSHGAVRLSGGGEIDAT